MDLQLFVRLVPPGGLLCKLLGPNTPVQSILSAGGHETHLCMSNRVSTAKQSAGSYLFGNAVETRDDAEDEISFRPYRTQLYREWRTDTALQCVASFPTPDNLPCAKNADVWLEIQSSKRQYAFAQGGVP